MGNVSARKRERESRTDEFSNFILTSVIRYRKTVIVIAIRSAAIIRLFDRFSSSEENSTDEDDEIVAAQRVRRRRIFKPRINFEFPPSDNQSRFRLTDTHVGQIVDVLAPIISHDTDRNFALSADQQVRLALRYLSSGDYFRNVADAHGVHKSTLSRTLHRFVSAVNVHLYHQHVDWLNTEEQGRGIVEKFFDKAGMPSVLGCVDGTHIGLVNIPKAIEAHFVNRHGQHSINAMFVCGPTLR